MPKKKLVRKKRNAQDLTLINLHAMTRRLKLALQRTNAKVNQLEREIAERAGF